MNEGPDQYPAADHAGGALRTAANQSVSGVSDQPRQVEQRSGSCRATLSAFAGALRGSYKGGMSKYEGLAANPLKRALLAACTLP